MLKKTPGSLLVKYNSLPPDPSVCSAWYAVTCDNFKDVGEIRGGKNRKEIKRGLANCEVRQLEASFIAKHGYDVYLSAHARYQGVLTPVDKDTYEDMIKATIEFDDIYHYWGAFYKDKLISYFVVVLYGNEAADLSVGKFIPEYLHYRPSDALIYTIQHHYLINESIPYITAGYTNIYHKTYVQQYVLKKFPFKKAYLKLEVTYSHLLQSFLKLTFPLRTLLGKLHHDLHTIYRFEEIRRNCAIEAANSNSCKTKEKPVCAS